MKHIAGLIALVALSGCAQIDDSVQGLARAPEAVVCGWTADNDALRQLEELPEGSCWLITPTTDELAIESPGLGACKVSSGPKMYHGGDFIERWVKAFNGKLQGEYKSEIVGCL